MRFMIIRKADPRTEAGEPPSPALARYRQALIRAGVLLAGEGLQPSASGARVKFSNGKPAISDGPFLETRELIAGFAIIQTRTREEALEWMKRWPAQDAGGEVELELRQILDGEVLRRT